MSVTANTSVPVKGRRWRFGLRFSLRFLFLGATVFALLAALAGNTLRRGEMQRRAVAELERHDASVNYANPEAYGVFAPVLNFAAARLGRDAVFPVEDVTFLSFSSASFAPLADLPGLTSVWASKALGSPRFEPPGASGSAGAAAGGWYGSEVRDADLAYLAQSYRLKELTLLGTGTGGITDAGLAPLHELSHLEMLTLDGQSVNGSGLVHLARNRQLRELNLAQTPFHDAGAEQLLLFPELKSLDLTGTKITDAAAASLAQLELLETLALNDTQISDHGFAEVAKLPHLRALSVGGCAITADGLAALGRLPNLKALQCSGRQFDRSALLALQGAKGLCSLVLHNTSLTDDDVPLLLQFPLLEQLTITESELHGRTLGQLAQLSSLKDVILDECPLGDEAVDQLLPFASGPNNYLSVRDTKLSQAGKRRLCSAVPTRPTPTPPSMFPIKTD